jgi:hypothetical protein
MKMAFKEMEELPADELKKRKMIGIPKLGFSSGNKWWLGFFLLVIAPLPMDFVALGLASASLVFPVGTAANVIVGQVIAPHYFEGEKLGRREWAGTALIVLGATLTSAFGDHTDRTFTSDEILQLWGADLFLVMFIPLTVLFAITAALSYFEKLRARLSNGVFFVCIVYIPSYMGGVQTIAFKSVSEMTANAVGSDDGVGEFDTWKPWLFVFIVIPLAVVQLKVINIGAEYFQATKFFPTYSAGLMIMVVIYGAAFFEEYDKLHPVAFPIGLLLLCVGIFMLAGKDPTDSSAVAAAGRRNGVEGDVPAGNQNKEEKLVEMQKDDEKIMLVSV